MFTFVTLTCFTLMILAPIAIVATWFYWPRLSHMRAMQNPITKAETELSLMRQTLGVERQRTEIDLLRLKTIRKDEAIFDASMGMLHQNHVAMLAAPQTDATAVAAPLPELMPLLMKCDSILIVARKGAGKSNLIRRLIDTRHHVTVLDPHASPQQWGAHEVVGAGLEFESIRVMLHETIEAERRNRYKQLGQGVTEFAERTFTFDEMTEVTSEIDVTAPVQRLLNCRKVNMKVIMGGHSMNAPDLGLNGKFNLLKNFDAVVKIDYNKATNERRYWLCLQPMSHHDEFVEVANPGIYTPPVQAVPVVPRDESPVPASVPVSSPVPDLGRYQGRDLEIAQHIVAGKSQNWVKENVKGNNQAVWNRYDEIKAELYPSWDLSALIAKKGGQ